MNRKKFRGYILLEILIAVLVVLGLTLWWLRIELHNNKRTMAKVMTQQISEILNAVDNYYEQDQLYKNNNNIWPPKITINELITKKYLLPKQSKNPFGYPYYLMSDYRNRVLILTTKVNAADSYIAQAAISPLTNAKVNVPLVQNGYSTIKVKMAQPAAPGWTPKMVRYYGTVNSGQVISNSKLPCPSGYQPVVIASQDSCDIYDGSMDNQCQVYVTHSLFSNDWYVYLKKMTRLGWQIKYDTPVKVSYSCVER